MNRNTELVFILDRSGSMSGREEDVIGGFNSTLEQQKEASEKCFVTTILFSDDYETVHDRLDIREVKKMERRDFQVGGCTALIDAIGKTIEHISDIHRYIRKEDVPERTLFVIMTDGMENASRKYSSEEVKRMISQKKECHWEFLFLGANIDAVETAKTFGIREDRAVNYHNDRKGISATFGGVKSFMKTFMNTALEDEEVEACLGAGAWRAEADEDYKSRS
ncbi:MAG: VWA domain-containing protein [Erysipelotrichaceae bacterium]|nr:VWA domain-containing protein [Erysipelotrichaceae bacterium]